MAVRGMPEARDRLYHQEKTAKDKSSEYRNGTIRGENDEESCIF